MFERLDMYVLAGLFAAYFGVLALGMFWQSQTVRGPWLYLLRAFFPNWQFYHQVGSVPHLYVRSQEAQGPWSDWRMVYPRHQRSTWRLFHNPWGNRDLAQQNLVEHLSSDIKELGEGADASQLVSYQLVCRLAAHAIRTHQLQATASHYQLEIRLERSGPQGLISTDTVLRSPSMTL
jgi:hypothetical protein